MVNLVNLVRGIRPHCGFGRIIILVVVVVVVVAVIDVSGNSEGIIIASASAFIN